MLYSVLMSPACRYMSRVQQCVGVHGSGAIGSVFAGALALCNSARWGSPRTVLVSQRKSRSEQLKDLGGIRLVDRSAGLPDVVSQAAARGEGAPAGSLWAHMHPRGENLSVLAPVEPLWVGTSPFRHDPPIDLSLLCVKGARARDEAVARSVDLFATSTVDRVAQQRVIVCLMNGGGHFEAIKRLVPHDVKVVIGTTASGARTEPDGSVAVTGWGDITLVDDGAGSPEAGPVSSFAATLADAMWPMRVVLLPSAQRDDVVWRKLVANVIINSATALAGVPNGRLEVPLREAIQVHNNGPTDRLKANNPVRSVPELLLSLDDALIGAAILSISRELVAVCHAAGVLKDVNVDGALRIALRVVEATRANTSSMLADVQQGRETEVDYVTGFVVDTAKRVAVPTPALQSVQLAIAALPRATAAAKAADTGSRNPQLVERLKRPDENK